MATDNVVPAFTKQAKLNVPLSVVEINLNHLSNRDGKHFLASVDHGCDVSPFVLGFDYSRLGMFSA